MKVRQPVNPTDFQSIRRFIAQHSELFSYLKRVDYLAGVAVDGDGKVVVDEHGKVISIKGEVVNRTRVETKQENESSTNKILFDGYNEAALREHLYKEYSYSSLKKEQQESVDAEIDSFFRMINAHELLKNVFDFSFFSESVEELMKSLRDTPIRKAEAILCARLQKEAHYHSLNEEKKTVFNADLTELFKKINDCKSLGDLYDVSFPPPAPVKEMLDFAKNIFNDARNKSELATKNEAAMRAHIQEKCDYPYLSKHLNKNQKEALDAEISRICKVMMTCQNEELGTNFAHELKKYTLSEQVSMSHQEIKQTGEAKKTIEKLNVNEGLVKAIAAFQNAHIKTAMVNASHSPTEEDILLVSKHFLGNVMKINKLEGHDDPGYRNRILWLASAHRLLQDFSSEGRKTITIDDAIEKRTDLLDRLRAHRPGGGAVYSESDAMLAIKSCMAADEALLLDLYHACHPLATLDSGEIKGKGLEENTKKINKFYDDITMYAAKYVGVFDVSQEQAALKSKELNIAKEQTALKSQELAIVERQTALKSKKSKKLDVSQEQAALKSQQSDIIERQVALKSERLGIAQKQAALESEKAEKLKQLSIAQKQAALFVIRNIFLKEDRTEFIRNWRTAYAKNKHPSAAFQIFNDTLMEVIPAPQCRGRAEAVVTNNRRGSTTILSVNPRKIGVAGKSDSFVLREKLRIEEELKRNPQVPPSPVAFRRQPVDVITEPASQEQAPVQPSTPPAVRKTPKAPRKADNTKRTMRTVGINLFPKDSRAQQTVAVSVQMTSVQPPLRSNMRLTLPPKKKGLELFPKVVPQQQQPASQQQGAKPQPGPVQTGSLLKPAEQLFHVQLKKSGK